MKIHEDMRLGLVLAVLAGYSYSLEKAWDLREKIRSAGLHQPNEILGKDVATVGNLMKVAGYDRGGITYIISPRLISLMETIQSGGLDGLADAVEAGLEDRFCALFMTVKGIGPRTAQIAWMLVKP